MTYAEKMRALVLIRFMTRLVKDAGRKVFLVLDNLRVHHSKKVKAWLQGREHQIEVVYLPCYSPELNPDEYLNCDLKAGVHSGPPARSKDDLKHGVIAIEPPDQFSLDVERPSLAVVEANEFVE